MSTSESESISCDHCGLPVPDALIDPQAEHQFCCNGCQTVYTILHGAGLENYYKIRSAVDAQSQSAATTGSNYEELDDPAFTNTWLTQIDDDTAEIELLLEGMHCAACIWLIERLPRVAPGVIESRANIRRRTVCIRFRPADIQLSKVAQSLDRLGYAAHPARGKEARQIRIKEDRQFLIRVAVAGALAGNIMLLAVALYGGAFSGISESWSTVFRWYSTVLGLIVLIWPGRVFFTGAIAALRTRTAHLDIPIALALLTAGFWGTLNTIRGVGEIYFDSISVLVFLLLVGRWIQHRQQRAASDSVELMLTLTPSSATRIFDDGSTKRVPIESIEAGHSVLVAAGESFPADGTITEGTTTIDNALLTGESLPVTSNPGDQALAGATNLSSPVTIRVQAVGEHSRIGRLMNLVAQASEHKAPVVRMADAIAGYFVIIVILLALGTFAIWTIIEGPAIGIEHATALLIVTCPCALGLATPMAMSVALGRSARAGMLIKSAVVLEQLSKSGTRSGTIVLDKTGTLTKGQTTVADSYGDQNLLAAAAAIEQASNHPIARAISAAYTDLPEATDITQTTGQGITGTVNNQSILIGSVDFVLRSHNLELPPNLQPKVVRLLDRALTPILVHESSSNRFALIGVGDQLRQDAKESIKALQSRNWNLQICSGDHPRIVESIANQLSIPIHQGQVTPEAKAQHIQTLKDQSNPPKHTIVMVGDGVNDAAALAKADVGIAVHGGAEASLEAADVYLVEPGVAPIVKLIDLSKSTITTIRFCMIFSLTYNVVVGTLAMAGLINALIAAIVMPISSLTVVTICTRAGKNIDSTAQHPEPS